MAAHTTPPPSPENIFATINSFQKSAALQAGIQLGLFTAIAGGADDPASIASRTVSSERGVRILSDALTVMGFLTKQNGKYALTEESSFFLNEHSPAYMGSVAKFLLNDTLMSGFRVLSEAVRKGSTAITVGDNSKPQDEIWVNFAKSMPPMTRPLAAAIAEMTGMAEGKPCRILDIAAGHGMYGITMAVANPHAQIVAADWPSVLEVAAENARAAGVADRFTALPGSAFESDLGEGYDFVLLTNIFHHFDQKTCERLMKRVYTALKPGGKAVTLEFVPNDDRVSPPIPAMFSLTMLAVTDHGDTYTFSQYQQMFRNAGFTETTLHPVPGMPQTILISVK